MPKIFLIKDRLQQQQLRLQEAQHLIQAKNSDQLNIDDSIERNTKQQQQRVDVQEPLSLVSKKRNIQEDEVPQHLKKSSDSGEYRGCCSIYVDCKFMPYGKSNTRPISLAFTFATYF